MYVRQDNLAKKEKQKIEKKGVIVGNWYRWGQHHKRASTQYSYLRVYKDSRSVCAGGKFGS